MSEDENIDSKEAGVQGYQDSSDYYADYLAWLSLRLHREVLLVRALRGSERQEAFLGLFISDDDIGKILTELHGGLSRDFPEGASLSARLASLEDKMASRLRQTQPLLAWQRLQQIFELNEHEISLILLALAPEIDPRFAKVYAYLQDDVARKHMCGALSEQLREGHDTSAAASRLALHNEAAIRRYQLLVFQGEADLPLLSRGLKLAPRLTHFLLNIPSVDDALTGRLRPPWGHQIALGKDKFTDAVTSTFWRWRTSPSSLLLLHSPGADIDLYVAQFAQRADMAVFELDWHYIKALSAEHAEQLIRVAIREGHLSHALVHIYRFDNQPGPLSAFLLNMITPLVVLSGPERLASDPALAEEQGVALLSAPIPQLSSANRLLCWLHLLPEQHGMTDTQVAEFCERYPLGVRALSSVLLNLTPDDGQSNCAAQLAHACRARVSHRMAEVAQRVSSGFGFDDLVLPPANIQALRDILSRQTNADKVMTQWGLSDVFFQSQSSAVLFVGPSGTGKTMAANVLANAMGLDLYRIELAGVVSKYIGETEKNLDTIFTEAAASRVVLFIDEADALFGKRTEVKDAHDRYANIEVSYLLQKMEQHQGLVILASNLGQNIDDAFLRRFSAVVEFAMPKVAQRLLLWEKLYQTQAPVSDNLDLEFLAEQFEISGGHIRNCILQAAFQAASQEEPICMQMLIRAIGKEYSKIGKPISKSSFGDYYAVIRRDSASG